MPNLGAAYDAMPDDVEPDDVIEFLTDKLEPDDLAKVKTMLGMEDDAPVPGASDARRRSAAQVVQAPKLVFPHANRLKF